MYRDITQWIRIRRRLLSGGVSQKQIERETGISRKTVRKIIEFQVPPGYKRQKPVNRPKLGPYVEVIDRIVQEDCGKPKKLRHTAKRIYEQLKEKHGFAGGLTIVKDHVREARHRNRKPPRPARFAASALPSSTQQRRGLSWQRPKSLHRHRLHQLQHGLAHRLHQRQS